MALTLLPTCSFDPWPVSDEIPNQNISIFRGAQEADAQEKSQNFVHEEVTITGDTLVKKVKELIHQGNIRRLILKNESGQTLMEIPLTMGLTGGVLIAAIFPVIAAIGVVGAMMSHVTIVIERQEEIKE